MPNEPDSQHQLEREFATFEKNRPWLLQKHEGRFALVKGDDVVGTFDAFEKAYGAGLAQFGTDPFLVRPIGACTYYTLSKGSRN